MAAHLVDSHAHLMDRAFSHDLDAVLERAREAGVGAMLMVGYSLPTSRAAIALANRLPSVRASVGIHPNNVAATPAAAFEEVERLARDRSVVAIGETGLDYYRDRTPRHDQRVRFEWHLRLAEALRLPLVVHSRDADADSADLLAASAARRSGGEAPGVLHCFTSEDPRYLARMLEAGYFVSFAGPLTYRANEALRAQARRVPLDRLLVETDCPYLAPVPVRGQRNEPAFVRHTAEQLAALRGMDLDTLAGHLWSNTARLFPAFATLQPTEDAA